MAEDNRQKKSTQALFYMFVEIENTKPPVGGVMKGGNFAKEDELF